MRGVLKTLISGIGLMADAYSLFVINLVKLVLHSKYPDIYTSGKASQISTAALAGSVAGQMVFGALADRIGRRAIFVTTISLVIVGAIGSATCIYKEGATFDLYDQMTIWLVLLGFGVGGEYPLSATVSSEGGGDSSKKRGKAVSSVFAMQGVGNLLASGIMYILLLCFKDNLDLVWRLALAAGAVPGLLTVYWRYKMEESEHYSKIKQSNKEEAALIRTLSGRFSPTVSNEAIALLQGGQAPGSTRALHAALPSPPPSPGGPMGVAGPFVSPSPSKRPVSMSGNSSPSPSGQGADIPFASPVLTINVDDTESVASCTTATAYPFFVPSWVDRWNLRPFVKLGVTIWEFRWTLLGTAGSWFIFDVVFYANGLFSGTILEGIGFSNVCDVIPTHTDLTKLALGNLILALIALPGYFVAIYMLDRMGRKNMQIMGFALIAAIFATMAAALKPLIEHSTAVLVMLYGLTFFFANFGPNMTTFVIPAEAFPTRAKATCHGISAASGKLGAVLGAALLPILKKSDTNAICKDGVVVIPATHDGLGRVLYACAGVAGVGLLWTLLLTKETKHMQTHDLDARAEEAAQAATPLTRSPVVSARRPALSALDGFTPLNLGPSLAGTGSESPRAYPVGTLQIGDESNAEPRRKGASPDVQYARVMEDNFAVTSTASLLRNEH